MRATSPMLVIFTLMFAALSALCSTSASEVLFSEDFEKFDLKKLPPGVTLAGKEISIEAVGGDRGNVLKIKNVKDATSMLTYSFDLAKVAGHTLKASMLVQFPGTFAAVAGKNWARPRFQFEVKDKNGKSAYAGQQPEPNKPDWQALSASIAVPKDAKSAVLNLKIDLVVAEAFFDNVIIELDADAKSSPTTMTSLSPDTPEGKAAKAPKKALEDGGILFGPEIAAKWQKKFAKPVATANTYLFAGAGLPNKEYEGGKQPANWKAVPPSKETICPAALPNELMASLAEYLAQQKPEVVVLFGDSGAARKPPETESFDWLDAVLLCQRFGAIPVLAVPAPGQQEKNPIREAMLEAANEAQCPVLDLKAPTAVPRNFAELAFLLDKHVFCRVAMDATFKKGTGKEQDE